ncbi:MAG: hypothetical protein M3281_06570 [Chloroflexota bacterium]|nr:hypothetical protein [Chloroflexota bacterium]
MWGAWFEALSEEYGVPIEHVEKLYRLAQSDSRRVSYALFIELLEEDAARRQVHETGRSCALQVGPHP